MGATPTDTTIMGTVIGSPDIGDGDRTAATGEEGGSRATGVNRLTTSGGFLRPPDAQVLRSAGGFEDGFI